MRQYIVAPAAIAAFSTCCAASAATLDASIDEAIRAELEQSDIPSLQVAIGRGDEILFTAASGLADVENQVPATTRTRYRSASISKWLTATGAMLLVEDGVLDLDQPVQNYCPQFPEKRWTVTTRQLLTHTSGVRHYRDYEDELAEAESAEETLRIQRQQMQDALSTYTRYTEIAATLNNFKADPLVFEPGTDWLYSSFGYRLLACVMEGAAQRDYRSYLAADVIGKAGMDDTVPDDAWAIIPFRATGYRLDRDQPLRRADMRDVSENLPAGGHLTTAADLVRFAQAFQAGKLVSEQSVTLMTQSLNDAPGDTENYSSWRHMIPSRDRYGYGLMSFPNETSLWVGHTGRQAGASAIVVLIPEEDLSIAVLTNVKGWGGYLRLVRELHAIVRTH